MGNAAKRSREALQAAVSTVSTAQILHASGYSAAEALTLGALSDIAGRYIESLGRVAVALAEAHGRTEPNVADFVLALEEHALGGFPGASDPMRPVLCSGALAELAGFVAVVREVPFAKGLPRRDPGSGAGKARESLAARAAVEKLVLGATARGGFVRFKADIPTTISKGAPDFCSVYVVNKGKVSSQPNSIRAAPRVSPLRSQIAAPCQA